MTIWIAYHPHGIQGIWKDFLRSDANPLEKEIKIN